MNRRAAGRLLFQGGGAMLLAGCEGLDLSAEGEGTGIQIVTALTILGRYRATQAQRAAAELAARRAFVAIAMKPAMKKEASVQQRKTVAHVESLPPSPPGTSVAATPPAATTTTTPGPSTEAAFAAAWKKTAEAYQRSGESAASQVAMPSSKGNISFPALSSRSILTASSAHAPNYFAVSVPRQGTPEDRQAGEVIMVWDARLRRLASDMAYAVKEKLKEGQRVKLDGLQAVYVGSPVTTGL